MDVTLLLNQSAGLTGCNEASRESTPSYAIGGPSTAPSTALPTPSPDRSFSRRDGETRHGRGRTPWSAGGYSLPLHGDSKFRSESTYSFRSASEQVDSEASYRTATVHSRTGSMDSDVTSSQESRSVLRPQPVRAATLDSMARWHDASERRAPSWDERRGEPSMAARHKFSDSHSSLSSYGSWQSRSHSRISSATTMSGSHAGGLSLAELPILESKGVERQDLKRKPPYGDEQPRHEQPRHEQPRLPAMAKRLPPAALVLGTAQPERPGSPSDAVLNMSGPGRSRQNPDGPRPPFTRATHLFSSPKLHKRAISAPDFASAVGCLPLRVPRQPYALLPPRRQAMAVPATSPSGPRHVSAAARLAKDSKPLAGRMDSSPDVVSLQTLPAQDKTKAFKGDEGEPRCMFVASCDTGSQLRKAISHLFGRNKSCTLKIPKEVWVYYCRKHYQRIRYRNARTYPSNQMELVKVQIRRLQTWSESNKAKGEAPYIKQWTLSLRKREQNRLESGKATLDAGDEDHAAAQSGSVVPDWIIQLVGDGYTTDKMLEIAERLHKDIAEGMLSQVPEIEFLPDIVDDDEGASAKPARPRRQNSSNAGSKMPKRKAPGFAHMSRQSSLSGEAASPEYAAKDDETVSGLVSPFGKRARLDRASDAPHPEPSGFSHGRAPMHAYAAPTYSDGRWGPPRAPKVVPKMRPLEYSLLREPDQAHARGFHPLGGGQTFYADARLTLPSISSHMSAAHLVPHPVPGGHGASRVSHQRSASAFTPATRPMPSSTRPSSSGSGAHAAPYGGLAMYELGSHTLHGGHLGGQPYHEESGWVTSYGPAYGPQRSVFHQAAMYGPVHCQDALSPRPGSGSSSSYGMPETSPTFDQAGNGA